jgi:predicted nucleic-acid-binding Zn-ribbon protein
MKDGICPKCGSNEVLSNLRVSGGQAYPPYVDIIEPEPEKRPFVWSPKSVQSHFCAYICGACGYTEFYAENYTTLNEGQKKGYISG